MVDEREIEARLARLKKCGKVRRIFAIGTIKFVAARISAAVTETEVTNSNGVFRMPTRKEHKWKPPGGGGIF